MLHRAADSHGDVQLRADRNARHAHLTAVGHEPRLHSRAGRTQTAPQLFCQRFQLFKARLGADAHAPCYDDFRLRQGLSLSKASERMELHPLVWGIGDGLHVRRFGRLLLRTERSRSDSGHLNLTQRADVRHQGISKCRTGLNQLLPLHTQGGAVRRQSRVQLPCKHGHNIPHPHRRRSQNDLATPSADRLQQKGGKSAFVPNFRGVEFKNAACAIFRGGFSLPRRNQSPQFAAGKPGGLAEQALIHAEGA